MGYTEKLCIFQKGTSTCDGCPSKKNNNNNINNTKKNTKQKTNVIDIVQPIEKIKL